LEPFEADRRLELAEFELERLVERDPQIRVEDARRTGAGEIGYELKGIEL
jgi:hypothetical protein